MPYAKTKDGSLVNEVTLGDGYPLSNDLQPLKVGGEASPIEMSTSLPDGSDNAKVKVRGDLEVTGGLNFKNDVEVDLSFDDLSLSGDLNVAGSVTGTLDVAGDTNITGDLTVSSSSDPSVIIEDPNGSGLLRLRRTDVSKNFDISLQGNDLRFTPTDTNGTMNVLIGVNAGSSTIDSRLGVGNATPSEMLDVTGNALISGNVGIGTTSPSEMLHLQGTGDVKILLEADTDNTTETDNPEILFSQDGGAVTGSIGFTDVNDLRITNAYNHDDGDIHLQTRSTTRMSVLGNGNVGIGVTSPDVPLEINGGSGTDLDPLLRINKDVDGDGSATGILIGAVAAGQSKAGIFFENKGIGSGRGSLHFCSDNTNDTSDATIADARMTIIDGGNVGIGTTSPTTTLDVEGTVSYKHTAFTTAGPTDNVDVSGTTVLECDTSGGHLTIGGFSGGVQGQILYVLKTTTDLNRVILENNEGGGSQDIFLSSGADLSISLPSGIALYCNGSDWFALDK